MLYPWNLLSIVNHYISVRKKNEHFKTKKKKKTPKQNHYWIEIITWPL